MNRTNLVLAAVVVLLAGALGVWFTGQDGAARRGAAPTVVTPQAGSGDGAEPVSLLGAEPSPEPSEIPAAVVAPTSVSERSAAVPVDASRARPKIRLRVIDGEGGPPVAGAEVFVRFLESESEPLTAGSIEAVRQEDVDRANGTQLDGLVTDTVALLTDADGLVLVPAPIDGSTIVVAREGERWGRRVLDEWGAVDAPEPDEDTESREPEVLVLVPDQTLTARVVDTLGQPVVGAPVQLQYQRWDNWNDVHEQLTAAGTGEVRFPHAQLLFRKGWGAEDWRLAVAVVQPETPHRVLDPEDLPAEPVVIELVRGGTVLARVRDPLGELLTEGGSVSLGIVAEGQSRRLSAFERTKRVRVERELVSEVARFEHVAPGTELELRYSQGGGHHHTYHFAPGPRAVGEVVELELTVGEDHPVLGMRVVDADGEPLAEDPVEIHVDNDALSFGGGGQVSRVTDAEGRLWVDLDHGWTKGSVQVGVMGMERSALLELSEPLPDGPTEIGDVVLEETSPIVSGRVVGPAGEVVVEAQVRITENQSGSWEELWELDAETDEAGRFEVRGQLPTGSYRLNVTREGYTATPLDFEPGTTGLVVPMSTAGALVGSVLLDPEVPAIELRVYLEATGEEPVELNWEQKYVDLEEDGSFRCGSLPAGEYDVELQLGGNGHAIHRVEGVLVRAGPETRDPRLDAVDLRGRVHRFRFTFEAPEDVDRVSGSLQLGPAGAESRDLSQWFHGEELVVLSPHRLLDVDVLPSGYRPEHLRGVSGDVTVELRRGFPVRVKLVGDGEVPEPPYGLSVAFEPVDVSSDGSGIDWSTPRFDERREVLLRSNAAGSVRVRWIVEMAVSGSAMATLSDAEPEQIVHLVDTQDGQTVEVRLTKEEAARLKELLGN